MADDDAHTFRDGRAAFRQYRQCLWSRRGNEPASPYFMLTEREHQFIHPSTRGSSGGPSRSLEMNLDGRPGISNAQPSM
ncbi:MAG: hypothetical protein WDW38_005800 [Sanguina aurantia]